MEHSEVPVYYKGDDGIYRPMVDIRQVPSTSSGIYKTILWNRSTATYQHHPTSNFRISSSVRLDMSKLQTKASNLEASENAIRQSENTFDTHQLSSPSSGTRKSRVLDRLTFRHHTQGSSLKVNEGEEDQLKNAVKPVNASGIQAIPRVIGNGGTNNNNFDVGEKGQVESSIDVRHPSTYLKDTIEPKQDTTTKNLNVCPRKKTTKITALRKFENCSPKIMPKHITKIVDMKIALSEEQIVNLPNSKQSQAENSVICSPIILKVQKSLSLPEFLPKTKHQTKRNVVQSFRSEIDLGRKGCATNSEVMVSENQIKHSPNEITSQLAQVQIIDQTNIQSLLPKTFGAISCNKKKEVIVEISNDKQEHFKNVINTEESQLHKRGENILNKRKQTKQTNKVNALKGNKKVGNIVGSIQELPSTNDEINKPMEFKKIKQPKKVNNVDASIEGEKVVENTVGMQQQASSSSEMYRPLVFEMQKSLCLLDSFLPNKQEASAHNFESCSGVTITENVTLNQQQFSTSSGINSIATKNALKTDVEHLFPRTSTDKVLWNLPDSLILPDLSVLKKRHEVENTINVEMDNTHVGNNKPDCSENDLLHNLKYGDLKSLYSHIMGTNSQPGTLREIGILTVRTMLCCIDQKLLVKLIENDEFLNVNRLVFWGVNQKRPLGLLFSTVKPINYSLDYGKTQLLKYVNGSHFLKNKKERIVNNSNHLECQACHKKVDSLSRFLNHLNLDISEITYMCLHCGYLRFTNACALVYHVLTDNYMQPTLEYCLVCGLYCESLSDHLMDSDNIINNKKVQCNLCEFTAFSLCSFKFHLAYHTDELPYVCPECGEYFSFKKQLKDHMKNVCFMNYKFKYYFCTSESCGLIFSYLENFYSHISTEHYERRVICTACHTMFSAQREFLAHRTEGHPDQVCSYNVYNYCTLCPNSTFRAMSQQKHLTNHGLENKCSIIVYKCQCDFQTLFKNKFIDHKKAVTCRRELFHRPQVLKICERCLDVQSFNYMIPHFICEECQQILQPSLSLMNYYCELCHLVIDYSWKSVLDHFFVFHKRVDLLSLSLHTMLIVSKKKVVPGRYLSQRAIIDVDVEFMNNYVKELPGSKNNPTLATESKKSDPSSFVDLTKGVVHIRVRSPSSINASLPSINHYALPSHTFVDNSGIKKQQISSHNFEKPKLNALGLKNISVPATKGPKNVRKDIFFCRKCNFTSCVQSEMSRHCQSHYPAGYKCSECDHSFKTPSARNNHLNNDHGLHLLAANQGHMKSVKHGEVQKILKQQIQGKLSIKQARKKSGALKQVEGMECEGSNGKNEVYADND